MGKIKDNTKGEKFWLNMSEEERKEHRKKMKAFADTLNKYMRVQMISKRELAKRSGLSYTMVRMLTYNGVFIQNHEKSKIPHMDVLIRLALALGVEIEDIVPEDFDLREHLEQNQDPDNYQSVEAFVKNLLEQFYQYRNNVRQYRAPRKSDDELAYRHVTEAVLKHYIEVDSEKYTKCYVLREAIRQCYCNRTFQKDDLEEQLFDLLHMYFLYDRPEEEQDNWSREAIAMMETIKARRAQEYEQIELLASDFLEGPEVGDPCPIVWDEVVPVDFEKLFEDKDEQEQPAT